MSATSTLSPSGLTMKDDHAWIKSIGDHVIAYSGDFIVCETVHRFLTNENRRRELSFKRGFTLRELTQLSSSLIARKLRQAVFENDANINLLIAGWEENEDGEDKAAEPSLYWLDEVGSLKKVQYGVHGHELPFLVSFLDRESSELHRLRGYGFEAVTVSEAEDVVERCWQIVQKRSQRHLAHYQTEVLRRPQSSSPTSRIPTTIGVKSLSSFSK